MHQLSRFLARPLVGLWLKFSTHSWERHVTAGDSPHVHAPGTDPDRVLLTGDGAATGRGVRPVGLDKSRSQYRRIVDAPTEKWSR